MRAAPFAVSVAVAALLLLAGCGGGGSEEKPVAPQALAPSVERQAEAFLDRPGTVLNRNLEQFLGSEIAARVRKGSAECRSGRETASISDPSKYPFACIVEGSADGRGLTVNVTLGFVGLRLDGRCWRAANERVAVTTSAPALLTRREAMHPVNQIVGCA